MTICGMVVQLFRKMAVSGGGLPSLKPVSKNEKK